MLARNLMVRPRLDAAAGGSGRGDGEKGALTPQASVKGTAEDTEKRRVR